MSTFNNHDNFTSPYDTDEFNVPRLLRGSSIQEQYLQHGTEDWVLGKHVRGFFDDEEMDIDQCIQQNANKRLRYSDEVRSQGEFAPFSSYEAYPDTLNMEMPFTPVFDSNQTSSLESQEIYSSTESRASDYSEDSSKVQEEDK